MAQSDRFGDSGGITVRNSKGKKIAPTSKSPTIPNEPPTQESFDGDKELDRILKASRDATKKTRRDS